MPEERRIVHKIIVETAPETAFEAMTKASELREWFSDQAWTQVQPGGRYAVRWNRGYQVEGTFTELDPPHRAAFTWYGTGDLGKTSAAFTVEPVDGGVEVTVVHSGFGAGAGWDQAIAEAEKGWSAGLENLRSTLETGVDLRIARQPFLGINLDLLTAERAEKEGIAAERGIYVLEAVEGSGAKAAGLGMGDVIVSLGGIETPGFQGLGTALRACQAGDVVDVELVRGQQRETVQVTLGQRPVPELPETAEELARQLSARHQEVDAELKAAVKGLTEEEAEQQPPDGAWSVKEVLAHLSAGERQFHTFLAAWTAVGWVDVEPVYPDAIPNRRAAVLAVTPTLQGLLDRFFTDEAETVALMANLPEKTVAHKARFRRIAQFALFGPDHARGHIEQIKGVIKAVQSE